jgi:hypothetical protein
MEQWLQTIKLDKETANSSATATYSHLHTLNFSLISQLGLQKPLLHLLGCSLLN